MEVLDHVGISVLRFSANLVNVRFGTRIDMFPHQISPEEL